MHAPKPPSIELIHADFCSRGLVDSRGTYPGDKSARAVIAGALTKAEDWLEMLPVIAPLPDGWRYSPLTLREFLDLFLTEGRGRGGRRAGPQGRTVPVVDGDFHADIHEIWRRRAWTGPIKMVVRGVFSLAHCDTVQSLEVTCLDSLTVEDCPQLKSLRGETFGHAMLTNSGIEDLGADFRCGGELFLEGCRDLRRINCEVGGDFTAKDCGLRSTGPAFSVEGEANFLSCPELEQLEGTINGKGRIERPLQGEVDCSKLLVRGNLAKGRLNRVGGTRSMLR